MSVLSKYRAELISPHGSFKYGEQLIPHAALSDCRRTIPNHRCSHIAAYHWASILHHCGEDAGLHIGMLLRCLIRAIPRHSCLGFGDLPFKTCKSRIYLEIVLSEASKSPIMSSFEVLGRCQRHMLGLCITRPSGITRIWTFKIYSEKDRF